MAGVTRRTTSVLAISLVGVLIAGMGSSALAIEDGNFSIRAYADGGLENGGHESFAGLKQTAPDGGGDGTGTTPTFTGLCETWTELKNANQATINAWSSPLRVDYYWHKNQGAEAEQAWLEGNSDAYNAANTQLMAVLHQLDNSTGPNGEVGRVIREDIADPVSHAMLNSFPDQDPATLTAADYDAIRNVGVQTTNQRCAPYPASTIAFAGICESWPELKHASQVTIETWSGRLMVEYRWHKRQGAAAEQAWMEENGSAYNTAYSKMMGLLYTLDNSTGPNGENGLTMRQNIADPASHAMLNSYPDRDPATFTAADYEDIRTAGLQSVNEGCAMHTP